MKKIFVSVLVLSLSFTACKTAKHVKSSAYEPAINNAVQEMKSEPIDEKVSVFETAQPIVMKTEEVRIEKSQDPTLRAYYVIIGSFSKTENAYKLQEDQIGKGVPSVTLKSETGMLRVAALGTDSEQEARSKINQLRKTTKEFADVWLLKTK
ncbi:MAG: SPOR domain-containing protein [Prolixibacteraceae bacterium]